MPDTRRPAKLAHCMTPTGLHRVPIVGDWPELIQIGALAYEREGMRANRPPFVYVGRLTGIEFATYQKWIPVTELERVLGRKPILLEVSSHAEPVSPRRPRSARGADEHKAIAAHARRFVARARR